MRLKNIDTSRTAGKIEVMRAFTEGKQLAWKGAEGSTWWRLSGEVEPRWNWGDFHYAVVEESREVWGVYDNAGRLYTYRQTAGLAKEVAASASMLYPSNAPYTAVKFVEEVK